MSFLGPRPAFFPYAFRRGPSFFGDGLYVRLRS